MSTPLPRAVFLSYASQDAEAARRICETLRAAGAEVWFDQSELVGGDAWDQKIRGQIGTCALFMPVISANTQARREGYFRLEWKLAAQRTHMIADGTPFLVPVVIDGTRDVEALVPPEFKAVQWTRLANGETPEAFCRRVERLLGGESALVAASPASMDGGHGASNRAVKSSRSLLVFGGVAVAAVIAAGVWWVQKRETAGGNAMPAKPAENVAAATETSRLVARAWEQLNKPELARAELEIAEGFCKQATQLDANDADAWAAWSHVDSWLVYHNFDATPARREGARTKATRALNLAPASYEARLAHACQLVRAVTGSSSGRSKSAFDAEADQLLRSLRQEKPDEPRALLALGLLRRNVGDLTGARDNFGRLAKNPAFAATAWNELGWAEYLVGEFRAADLAVDRSMAVLPFWGNLGLKFLLTQSWLGDLDEAKVLLERTPAAIRQEDFGVWRAAELYYFRREPAAVLDALRNVPRHWLQSNAFKGPKAYYAALAHQMAGQESAASVQWQAALAQVEQRLAEQPDSASLMRWKGVLQAGSGNRAEAEKSLRLAREMGDNSYEWVINEGYDLILLGRLDEAVERLERAASDQKNRTTAAIFRLDPRFDPVRQHPRFQALLARAESDPLLSPHAKPASAVPADKSVAVLAFTNVGGDKANESFSDGISEELINVLGRVPGLVVKGRSSSFYFKGKDATAQEKGQKLGATYLVDGSVRKVGSQVRITAQLIRAATDEVLWSSEPLTRELEDVLALQAQIAGLVAQNLQLKIGGTAPAKIVKPEAHRLVLEGRHFLSLRDAGFAEAESAFTRALAIDADFAPAHSGIAAVRLLRGIYRQVEGATDIAEDLRNGRASAERAVQLDASVVEAHAVLGYEALLSGRLAESEQHFQRGLALNPNDAFCHHWRGHLLGRLGQVELALEENERSTQIDPLSFITLYVYAQHLTHARQHAKASEIIDRSLALRRDFLPSRGVQAMNLLALGRKDEAVAIARAIRNDRRPTQRWWADSQAVWVLCEAGRREEAEAYARDLLAAWPSTNSKRAAILAVMGRFDEALSPREILPTDPFNAMVYYCGPAWDPVRDKPLFQKRMVELGLADAYKVGREILLRMQPELAARK